MPVGRIVPSKLELCSEGLHRHLFAEATFSSLGVESLLLTAGSRCDDHGERIYYRGAGIDAAQITACLLALCANAEHKRPVRVLRPAATAKGASGAAAGGAPRKEGFRYDGLYAVYRWEKTGAPSPSDVVQFVLLRQPGQPSLPPGVGDRGRAADGEQYHHRPLVAPLALLGEVARVPAGVGLPQFAEEALAGPQQLSVGQALAKLRALRESLLGQLTPQESYVLVKRSAVNEAHLRSTLELLESRGSSAAGARAAAAAAAAAVGREVGPNKRMRNA